MEAEVRRMRQLACKLPHGCVYSYKATKTLLVNKCLKLRLQVAESSLGTGRLRECLVDVGLNDI